MIDVETTSPNLKTALIPLCFWAFLDAADGSYFVGILRALEVDLNLTMTNFTLMQGSTCLAVTACVPFWGVLIDKKILDQKALLILSSLGWGVTTLAMGFTVHSFYGLLALRFVNTGFMCGGLPITQSVVTSVAAPRYRGACFSACAVFGGLGTIVSGKLSADISEQTIRGFAGWRVGLVVIGGASIFFSALLSLLMPERTKECESAKLSLVLQKVRVGRGTVDIFTFMIASLKRSLSSYSVLVIVAQCCFYQCIMQTLLYLTMWLQYSGYSDSATGTLIGFWRVGTMLGKLAGGFIGDAFSEASRLHGRQLYGQIVCVSIIPLIALIFGRTVSAERQSFSHFAGLLFCFGLLGDTWCTGVNRPVLTQVVARSHVASTMAWKMTLDNAMGIVIGPAVLMHLATHFGFSSSHQKVSEMPNEFRAKNAEALGKLIFTVCVLSYFAMALVYTALQWTFAWDLQAAQKECDDDNAWGRGRLGEVESVQKAALEAKRYH